MSVLIGLIAWVVDVATPSQKPLLYHVQGLGLGARHYRSNRPIVPGFRQQAAHTHQSTSPTVSPSLIPMHLQINKTTTCDCNSGGYLLRHSPTIVLHLGSMATDVQMPSNGSDGPCW